MNFCLGLLVGALGMTVGLLILSAKRVRPNYRAKVRLLRLMQSHGKKMEVPYVELTPEYIVWWRKRADRLVALAGRVQAGKLKSRS